MNLVENMYNILFTSSGRRVELLQIFNKYISKYNGNIYATDNDETAPTIKIAKNSFISKNIENKEYIPSLINFAKNNNIKILIPLIDPELPIISKNSSKFLENNIFPMISNKKSIDISNDKLKTFNFFKKHKISTPNTWNKLETFSSNQFPLIIKPQHGSSGNNVVKCTDMSELKFYLKHIPKPIIQEYIPGTEVTIDVFGDGDGNVAAVIPRKRIKVRGGEVERAITIDDSLFREKIFKIVKDFKPFGAINIQCIVSKNEPYFIEINSRFGGGYPLSEKAGGNFPELLINLSKGKKLPDQIGKYKKGLIMSRYDNAIYQDISKLKNKNFIKTL
jgi:carbamoyl-phosphate synthase large subunit